jgi:hypothetical protein
MRRFALSTFHPSVFQGMKGTHQAVFQPDHWAMIDAGWFGGNDLFDPAESGGLELWIWQESVRSSVYR